MNRTENPKFQDESSPYKMVYDDLLKLGFKETTAVMVSSLILSNQENSDDGQVLVMIDSNKNLKIEYIKKSLG